MSQYIARRLLISIPVLLGVTAMVFLLVNAAPGDPLMGMLMSARGTSGLSEEAIELRRHQLGLDKPVLVRYFIWLREIMRGNLGESYVTHRPVSFEIMARLPPTLELMGVSTLFAIVVGIPLGVFSALKQYSVWDYIVTTVSLAWVCIPDFFFALLLIAIFALQLRVLPSGGFRTAGGEPSVVDNLRHLILPAAVLGMSALATYVRYTRSSVLEVIQEEYITVARSKGLKERVVVFRHALRNALLPVVTVIGLSLPWLFSGALIVETVFRWPGLGTLFMKAVESRDYTLIVGMNLIVAVMVVIANLVTDVAYAFVDPRIRYD